MADSKSNLKRKLRRAEERDGGWDKVRKAAQPRPVAPVITFFLDRLLCKVEDKSVAADRGVLVVYTRTVHTKRQRVRGKWVYEEHFGKWRPFRGAEPALARDQTTPLFSHIGIRAPITAWANQGLLDGMVDRDLPREQRRPEFKPVGHAKRAA
jgi:hypothetical protein